MRTYVIHVSLPSVYILEAEHRQDAVHQAVTQWRADNDTWLEPQVEVVSEEGIGLSFWDGVDAAIDDAKEQSM